MLENSKMKEINRTWRDGYMARSPQCACRGPNSTITHIWWLKNTCTKKPHLWQGICLSSKLQVSSSVTSPVLLCLLMFMKPSWCSDRLSQNCYKYVPTRKLPLGGGVLKITISRAQDKYSEVLKKPGSTYSLVLNQKAMVFGGWSEVETGTWHLHPILYTLSTVRTKPTQP